MEIAFYLIIGIASGTAIGWLIGKSRNAGILQETKDEAQSRFTELDKDFATYKASVSGEVESLKKEKATLETDLKTSEKRLENKTEDLGHKESQLATVNAEFSASEKALEAEKVEVRILKERLEAQNRELSDFKDQLSTEKAEHASAKDDLEEKGKELKAAKEKIEQQTEELKKLTGALSNSDANHESAKNVVKEKSEELIAVKAELKASNENLTKVTNGYATAKANLESLEEKLSTQKQEMEELREAFKKEFKLIANQLLEDNSSKFSEASKKNLESLLNPLGKDLKEFKTKVEEAYDKESKERFSLGEKVKELADLNQVISKEAKNLTEALKSQSKTQGRWGEMILESILEKSGLVKGQEYLMEHELKDEDGNHLKSEDNKKMRPDAVIKYPDNRSVIIDAKVSLNAFTRYLEAEGNDAQERELNAHVAAIKEHINSLSKKGYDVYDKALDFVMMFIPSEAAYIAAIKHEPNLWNYAYDRRILLLNPTNLITSLKLIVDLWKREYQNINANQIAERGAKLYDKFVGFVSNLEKIGSHIEKAQESYNAAYKQLSTGQDNLIRQTQKLKDLGVVSKKEIPASLLNTQLESIN